MNRDGAAFITSVLGSADFSHWDVSMKMVDLSIFCKPMNVRRQAGARSRVKKWIDTPDLRQYEKFVADWHYFLLDVQEVLYNATDAQLIKNLNLYVVNRFYMKTYEVGKRFL